MFDLPKNKNDIIRDLIVQIDSISENGISSLIAANDMAYNLFWKHPDVTPQEFCDVMGTWAYLLFQKSYETQSFIIGQRPSHTPLSIPEDYSVVFNVDGTVTVTKIVIPEEPVIEEPPAVPEESVIP